jgi:hypothetical protein
MGAADPWAFERWAFGEVTGSPTRKAVLMALAHMADQTTGRCECKQETLAQWVEVSERSVREHLRGLVDAGLIATRHQYRIDGTRRGSEFLLLAPGVCAWPDGERAITGEIPSHHPATERTDNRRPVAAQEQPPKNNRSTTTADGLDEDAETLLERRTRVNGRVVTAEEMEIGVAVVRAFNAAAGTGYGLGAHLTPIVGRARERPSWSVEQHVRLVESAFRLRWWERDGRRSRGRIKPNVIYGHAGVFEQVVQDAIDEANGKTVRAQRGRFEKRGAPGSDEL